jgi:hypothetical protein
MRPISDRVCRWRCSESAGRGCGDRRDVVCRWDPEPATTWRRRRWAAAPPGRSPELTAGGWCVISRLPSSFRVGFRPGVLRPCVSPERIQDSLHQRPLQPQFREQPIHVRSALPALTRRRIPLRRWLRRCPFVSGSGTLFQSDEQLAQRDGQSRRNRHQAFEADVLLPKLDMPDVRAVKAALVGEFLLAPSLLGTKFTDAISQHCQ